MRVLDGTVFRVASQWQPRVNWCHSPQPRPNESAIGGILDLLSKLFEKMTVPQEVWEELVAQSYRFGIISI